MEKKLYKVERGKQLCGVCAGFAKYFSVDVTLVWLGLVAFCLLGGSGVLAYIICALVMPEEPTDIIDV